MEHQAGLGDTVVENPIGEKVIEKIWETIHRGAGGCLAPWQYRRMADAKRGARRLDALSIAQTKIDIQQIHGGQKQFDENNRLVDVPADEQISLLPAHTGGAPSADSPHDVNYKTSGGLIESIEANEKARRLQKAVNLAETVSRAEEIAADTKYENVSKEEVDPDWFTRWRDGAEDVSTEELQEIWAKVLAGEVSNPGKYSLRTLGFLKTMSKADAQLIQKAAPFIVFETLYDNYFIVHIGYEFFRAHGLLYNDFLELKSMGFLHEAGSSTTNKTYASHYDGTAEFFLSACEKKLNFTLPDGKVKLKLPVCSLTQVGQEVIKLGHFTANQDYVKKIAETIQTQGIELYDISSEVRQKILL